MAKRRPKPTYDGLTFDSQDEIEFYWWCQEALEAGVLSGFRYQHPKLELSPKYYKTEKRFGVKGQELKPKTTTLIREATYTADFELNFASRELAARCGFLVANERRALVDVKPVFEIQQSRAAKFTVLQKWVFDKHKRYVYPVVPVDFFGGCWCPAKALLTQAGKVRKSKKYTGLPSLVDWQTKSD